MNRYTAGMIAGFAATFVLSVLMVMKTLTGLVPQLDVIALTTRAATQLPATPETRIIGWLVHFLVGTVLWGVLYAAFCHALPFQKGWAKGVVLGFVAWILMGLIVMPLGDTGFFGMRIGMIAPVMTLMLHLLYGAILGAVFAKLASHHA